MEFLFGQTRAWRDFKKQLNESSERKLYAEGMGIRRTTGDLTHPELVKAIEDAAFELGGTGMGSKTAMARLVQRAFEQDLSQDAIRMFVTDSTLTSPIVMRVAARR